MKALFAIVLAAAGFAIAAPEASAGNYRSAPACHVYKTGTAEVCRRSYCENYYDHCGRLYTVRYTVITFRDYYSNGTYRDYARTYRA